MRCGISCSTNRFSSLSCPDRHCIGLNTLPPPTKRSINNTSWLTFRSTSLCSTLQPQGMYTYILNYSHRIKANRQRKSVN
jgi:hypothetical protein